MATRARLAQDRSRQRREALLDAAIELFAEGGSRGITHRAVAARAGLPSATTTYYFASIDELISEALNRHVEQWSSEIGELTKDPIDADISIEDASSLISIAFAARPPQVVATQISIYVAAAGDETLRMKAAAALTALETLAEKLLQHVGVPDPNFMAEAVVAAIAGSALRRLSHDDDEHEAELLYRIIRGLVASQFDTEADVRAKPHQAKPTTVSTH